MIEVSSWISKMFVGGQKTLKCLSQLIGLNQVLLCHRGDLGLVSCALCFIVVGVHFVCPSHVIWFVPIGIYSPLCHLWCLVLF